MHQKEAWSPLLRMLQTDVETERGDAAKAMARGKVEVFLREVEECLKRHRMAGYKVPDKDLREQIKQAVKEMVVSAYEKLLYDCDADMQRRTFMMPEDLEELIGRLFEGDGRSGAAAPEESVPTMLGGRRLRKERRRLEGFRVGEGNAEKGHSMD